MLRGLLYRALFRSAGSRLLIYPHVYIVFSDHIDAGDRLAINVGTYIDGRGGIRFGDNVLIGPHCSIISVEHGHERIDVPMAAQPYKFVPVNIGNDVWIGANSCIRAGVTIGDGCIIGANAVVTRDIPPYAVAVGVPARIISYRKGSSGAQNAAEISSDVPQRSS